MFAAEFRAESGHNLHRQLAVLIGIGRLMIRVSLIERMIYPLALLTSVFGIVYWYWTTTPSYALSQVVVSLQNHDTTTFEKFVDIDSVASHAFDNVVDGPARGQVMGRVSMIGVGFIRMFKRDIIGIAHQKLIDEVAHGQVKVKMAGSVLNNIIPGAGIVWANDLKPTGPTVAQATQVVSGGEDIVESPNMNNKTRVLLREYGLTRGGFRGVKYLNTNGSSALLGLEFYSPRMNQNFVVEFKLEDAGGYWRVVELSNLNDLIAKYMQMQPS